MSGTDDLKDLLDRLKDEVGPLPEHAERAPRALPPAERKPQQGVTARFQRQPRPEMQREMPRDGGGAGSVWSENKETMLFGVLASIIMAFGGILAGLDYLVLAGTVFFMLFALVMFLALFGTYLNSRHRAAGPDPALNARVEAMARKLEALGSRPPSPGPLVQGGPERDRELEGKVEELRVLVKSLSRAVEHNGK
jgi:hypothetical protein